MTKKKIAQKKTPEKPDPSADDAALPPAENAAGTPVEATTASAARSDPPVDAPPAIRHCRNCGAVLHGTYCGQCSQENVEAASPSRRLIKEFLRDEFQLNSRFSRTIVPLLFRPGFLAQEYLAGRRTRYMTPLRSYLYVSMLLFALLAMGARQGKYDVFPPKGHRHQKETADSSGVSVKDTFTLELGQDTIMVTQDSAMDGAVVRDSLIRGLQKLEHQPDSTRKQNRFERVLLSGLRKAMQDPKRYVETLITRCAQGMFVLMPLFALLLKMLYIRRRRYYMEHLVFTLHYHAFTFFILTLLTAASLSNWAWAQHLVAWLWWTIPVYLLMGMKRFYGQRFGKTLLKFCMLSFAYVLVFAFVAIGVIFVSFMLL
jgi:hypothetical protein